MTLSAWSALAGEQQPDQAWLDTTALLVLDAIAGSASAEELIQLRTQIANFALAEWSGGSPASLGDQLRLLVVQLDATVERRVAVRKLSVEPTGRRAQLVDALRKAGGTAFSDQLAAATGMQPEHVSRACGQLLDAGLLLRRSFGRRAEWTLTSLAEAVRTEWEASDRTAGRLELLRQRLSTAKKVPFVREGEVLKGDVVELLGTGLLKKVRHLELDFVHDSTVDIKIVDSHGKTIEVTRSGASSGDLFSPLGNQVVRGKRG